MRNIAEGLQYGHVGWTYNRTDRSLIIGLTGNRNKKNIHLSKSVFATLMVPTVIVRVHMSNCMPRWILCSGTRVWNVVSIRNKILVPLVSVCH